MANSTTVASYTMLSTFLRCRMKFYWKYVEKIPTPQAVGMIRGIAGHEALATWYKDSSRYNEETAADSLAKISAQAVLAEAFSDDPLFLATELKHIEGVLDRYFQFARENDDFTTQDTEVHFKIKIPHADTGLGDVAFQGYIDGLVKDTNNRLWLLEHKFYKSIDKSYLDLDQQVSIYMVAVEQLGLEPAGVIYNLIRTGENKKALEEPVVRIPVYRKYLKTLKNELVATTLDMAKFLHEGGFLYRNATKDCHWDCPFYNACVVMNDDGDPNTVLYNQDKLATEGES